MGLTIATADLEAIRAHAERSYPEECCGLLLGHDGPAGAAVAAIRPAENSRSDRRENRFEILPETVLAVHREARQRGLAVIGTYHSHPDHPAAPSEFDREHAWPGLSYLIVSVRRGAAGEAKSWRLRDDRAVFDGEPVALLGRAAGKEPS
jgi:proteasome lid subunit RPN8/RPN11